MRINNDGFALIKEFEGLRLEAYKCPAGVWTIGYGHTSGVKSTDKITEYEAVTMLIADLRFFEGDVKSMVEVPLNENQFSALVSFTYNLGKTKVNKSTMMKILNQGKYDEVAFQMKRWNKAYVDGKKVVLPGLVRRRVAESQLFNKEEMK